MDGEILQTIYRLLDECRDEIAQNMTTHDKNASGKSASLFVRKGTELYGPAWYETLEKGRGPGKLPYEIDDILLSWAKSKGISFSNQSQARSWAFLVAKKIREEGTEQYRDKRYLDIYSSPILSTREKIKEEITKTFNNLIINELKD